MSDCYICDDEGVTTASKGLCSDCSQFACGAPSKRTDGRYHGAQCKCGCKKFVCKLDIEDHANRHGSSPEGCFPGFVLDVGAAVLEATHDALQQEGTNLRKKVASAGEDLLIAVGPGPRVLREVLSTTNDYLLEERSIGKRTSFEITPGKLTLGHMKRLAALAARAIANVNEFYDLGPIMLDLQRTQRRSLMAAIAFHADPIETGVPRPTAQLLVEQPVTLSSLRKLPAPSFLAEITPAPHFERGADELRWFLQLGNFAET